MKKIRIPTNTDVDGSAVCIKSNYFKMGCINFQPQIGGEYAATGVMEIIYEQDSDNRLCLEESAERSNL